MTDIEAEFTSCLEGLDDACLRRAAEIGVPAYVTLGSRLLYGVGKVVTGRSGRFEFHDLGRRALVIAEGVPAETGWSEVHDLVAVLPNDPGFWWLRRDAVDLLGRYNLQPYNMAPVTLYETPLRWLQGGAKGACIVNWNLDPNQLLSGTSGGLVAESEALRDRLRRRIVDHALRPWAIEVANAA